MLQSLHVHNFALIEDAKVAFTPGLNVFTGETGAGKSILIDAFGIVLGARASAGMVRSGTEGFWVQAVFDGAADARIETLLQEQGIEAEESLFLKRQVTAAGKSQSSINGVQVPLSVLKNSVLCWWIFTGNMKIRLYFNRRHRGSWWTASVVRKRKMLWQSIKKYIRRFVRLRRNWMLWKDREATENVCWTVWHGRFRKLKRPG